MHVTNLLSVEFITVLILHWQVAPISICGVCGAEKAVRQARAKIFLLLLVEPYITQHHARKSNPSNFTQLIHSSNQLLLHAQWFAHGGWKRPHFFAFVILIVHIVHSEIHCIHWNREKSGCWLHFLLYSWICSHPILWLNPTVQSFAFSASDLFAPIVAVVKETHFLALPICSLVTLIWPWCIPRWRLNVSIFLFFPSLVFLKRCIGIHNYADSMKSTIKNGDCRTLLITKQQDITHNRSTDVLLWSHYIILKHR